MMMDKESFDQRDFFSRLVKANYSRIKQFAYGLLRTELDAEDVTQEVFTRLWERRHIWVDNEREIDSYLLIMTRNIAINRYKHEQVRQEYEERFTLEAPSFLMEEDFLERYYCRETLQDVYSVLATLPERRRRAFELSRFDEKSYKEIADIMNVSVRTIERQIYLTLVELRKIFGNSHFS
ncbi:MAG: RNA polymerase sigma-70 factor [Bacteroides acidifaciens]|nr:RNA polymerase sigma-70 factor [Bacteroides acidifaciens]